MKACEKPLFIPLKTEYFNAFKSGEKSVELRNAKDKRWSANNCSVGRAVTLSRCYGKHERLSGVVAAFAVLHVDELEAPSRAAFKACYGEAANYVSCIHISNIAALVIK